MIWGANMQEDYQSMTESYQGMAFTYEWGRRSRELLSHEAGDLDKKIIGLLASASIVIGLLSTHGSAIKLDITSLPLGIGALSFLSIFAISMWSLRARDVSVADDPTILQEDYWSLDQQAVMEHYWPSVIAAFKMNLAAVKVKSCALKWIVPLLGIEVISLLAWLLFIPRL
jgi:hypothetical protein